METVQEIISQLQNAKTTTSSKKDELRVMRAMLNDTNYKVAAYNSSGEVSFICPSEIIRNTCASVMAGVTKMSMAEANHLMARHEFKRSEAENMIEFSKEFVNTYLESGRKLAFGGRERSNVAISKVHKEACYRKFPKREIVDGKEQYNNGKTWTPAHDTFKVHTKVPTWFSPEEYVGPDDK